MYRPKVMKPSVNRSHFVSCYLGESTWRPSNTLLYVLGVCLIVVPVAAVLLNLAQIVFVCKAPTLKKHTRFYLTAVAVCDIVLGLTMMPYKILGMIKGDHRTFSKLGCDIGNSIHTMMLTVIICFLCILSFDRCIASCRPFELGYWFGRKHGWKIFVTAFCFSVMLSFGSIMPNFHIRGLETMQTCLVEQQRACKFMTNVYYSIFLCAFGYVFPSIVICICNYKTTREISLRQQIFLKLANVHTKRASYRRRYYGMTFSHTIVSMTTVCLLFMLPFFTLTGLDPWLSFRTPDVIWLIVTWLVFAHSFVNPLLYLHSIKILRFRNFLCS